MIKLVKIFYAGRPARMRSLFLLAINGLGAVFSLPVCSDVEDQ